MCPIQTTDSNDQYKLSFYAKAFAQDETSPTSVITTEEDWFLAADVNLKGLSLSASIGKLLISFHLTRLEDAKYLVLSDEQDWLPQKLQYDFKIPIRKHSFESGTYRALVHLKVVDKKGADRAEGFEDMIFVIVPG